MAPFLHLICDYAPGDLAWAEVAHAVAQGLPDSVRWHLTTVGSFETIATGFVLAQLALAGTGLHPGNTVVFANCAPRKDLRDPRTRNEGEGLLYGVMKNGTEVLAVNSGFSLSFIRDDLRQLWSVHVEHQGSQFRSRDYFPGVLAQLMAKDHSFRNRQLDPQNLIPSAPERVIGYVDSFGNLKTTMRNGDKSVQYLQSGERIKVIIGNTVRTATVAAGSFNVMEGDLAFAPGSSGHDRRFWEFFQRGGSAWHEFGRPPVGSSVQFA